MRDSLTLLRTPVSAIYEYALKVDNAAIVMLHCISGPPGELMAREKLISRE